MASRQWLPIDPEIPGSSLAAISVHQRFPVLPPAEKTADVGPLMTRC